MRTRKEHRLDDVSADSSRHDQVEDVADESQLDRVERLKLQPDRSDQGEPAEKRSQQGEYVDAKRQAKQPEVNTVREDVLKLFAVGIDRQSEQAEADGDQDGIN